MLSGDINKYNDLFLRIEEEDIIKKYETFKLLINIYLLNSEILEQYIKEHLLNIQEKEVIIGFLKKRADFKSNKLDELIHNLF